MSTPHFYGVAPPGEWDEPLPGRLIVIEGTDGVGRSTQVSMLKEWLEDDGYAVVDTGLRRSQLAGSGIERAKRGHTLDPITLNLFYATDLWDQLERQILPALRAGMVALVDRYIFSIVARAVVRGVPRGWIEDLYGFALVPDRVIYLDIDVPELIPRVLARGGFDYWESGRDYIGGNDVYGSFVTYQTQLLGEFRRLAEKHAFTVVDARGSVIEVFGRLRHEIAEAVSGMKGDPAAGANGGSPAPPR